MTVPSLLTFHGAARTVTGSSVELETAEARVLFDCGLFQGSRTLETLNHEAFPFAVDRIAAVILTHAHIDHCGLLPKLVKQGFAGAIWCTQGTADLLEFMLADAGRIQEGEAERRNRRRDRADEAAFTPLYTEEDAIKAWRQCRPISLMDWFEPARGIRARLWNAGHILGSASAEVEAGDARLLFSGDLGPEHKAFHPDPDGPSAIDHVICESTYGNRDRPRPSIENRRALLEEEINQALVRGGNLIIPAFALERTQELLVDIATLLDGNRIPGVPVFVDSPLATRATSVFSSHASELEDLGSDDVFRHPGIHYVNDVSESMRLNTVSGAIILAASGMCEAGRIRHHLKHNLHRRESTVLFVGFQAQGSLGRVILEGARHVRISGTDVAVRAQVREIESYSAHADRSELRRWIAERQPIAGSLFLSHGEQDAIDGLRALVQEDDKALSIIAPEIGETFELRPAAPARRVRTGRPDQQELVGRDWQNDYAEFATGLKQHLAEIRSEKARRKAIAEMRRVLDSYAEFRSGRNAGEKRE